MKRSFSLPKYAFFLAIALLLLFWGQIGLPVAHYFHDALAIRDTGFYWADLADKPNGLSNFLQMAFRHHEGSIQFFMLNFYCSYVGDIWPLNPATMQLPNTVLAFFAAVFCFLMAQRIGSTRFAYFSTTVFVLGPWLAYTIRLPWYFDTLSCLLHFSTFYFLTGFMTVPQSRLCRVAWPASFSLYLLSSLDWPVFLPCLMLFVLLSGQLSRTLRNPFNFLPAVVIGLLILWQVFLYVKVGEYTLDFSRAVYPFWSFLVAIQHNTWLRVWDNVILPWGPQMLLAGIGAGIYLFRIRRLITANPDKPIFAESQRERQEKGSDSLPDRDREPIAEAPKPSELDVSLVGRIQKGFFDAMCLWFFAAIPPLLISGGSATYLYVVAMPSALLAGMVLLKMRYRLLIPCVLVLAISQVYFLTDKQFAFVGDKKQRVLAAACFLNEQRPDLLTAPRTPVIAGFDGAAAFQYSRPTNFGCQVGPNFPLQYGQAKEQCMSRGGCSVTEAFWGQQRTVVNPWFIIDSSALIEQIQLRPYWLGFLQDPSVNWIAQFREPTGEVIYIGEAGRGASRPAHEAPSMDVNSLSEEYLRKYDRLKFLKKNLDYVYHF
jgi:hypothetical protein